MKEDLVAVQQVTFQQVTCLKVLGTDTEGLTEFLREMMTKFADRWNVEPFQLSHTPVYWDGKYAYALIWLERGIQWK